MASGIYSIEHVASGRRYVGSAANIDKRWKEHRRQLARGVHHSRFLQRAWDKHGEQAFQFTVVLLCDRHNLLWYEQSLIDAWRPEYNSAPTAGSQLGLKMSDEAKAKMSAAAKRTRNFTGHRHSEETKRRISEAKAGRKFGPYGPERCASAGAAQRGRPKTELHKQRLSASLKGRKQDPEVVARRAASNRGRTWSVEEREMRMRRFAQGAA
jgi:group I intron endonuclease